jgi:hypothetical protein
VVAAVSGHTDVVLLALFHDLRLLALRGLFSSVLRLFSRSGSLAILIAIRRASSRVSKLAALRRPGSCCG